MKTAGRTIGSILTLGLAVSLSGCAAEDPDRTGDVEPASEEDILDAVQANEEVLRLAGALAQQGCSIDLASGTSTRGETTFGGRVPDANLYYVGAECADERMNSYLSAMVDDELQVLASQGLIASYRDDHPFHSVLYANIVDGDLMWETAREKHERFVAGTSVASLEIAPDAIEPTIEPGVQDLIPLNTDWPADCTLCLEENMSERLAELDLFNSDGSPKQTLGNWNDREFVHCLFNGSDDTSWLQELIESEAYIDSLPEPAATVAAVDAWLGAASSVADQALCSFAVDGTGVGILVEPAWNTCENSEKRCPRTCDRLVDCTDYMLECPVFDDGFVGDCSDWHEEEGYECLRSATVSTPYGSYGAGPTGKMCKQDGEFIYR